MKSQHFEYGGSAGPNQNAGTAINVKISNLMTITNAQPVTTRMHPISVQYVDDSAYQDVCSVNYGHVLYPVFTVAETGTVNTTASGEHYSGDTVATTFTRLENHSPQGVSVGQLLAEESGEDVGVDMTHSFIAEQGDSLQIVTADAQRIAPGNASGDPLSPSSDGRSNSLHHFCSLETTDEWLKRNYEEAEGEILLRATLQNHYHHYCKENYLYPTSSASLGRRVHEVFPHVETKRLGRRGQSKYHYCGIHAIPGSSVSQLNSTLRQQPSSEIICKLPSSSGGSGSAIPKTGSPHEQYTIHSPSSNDSNPSQQGFHRQYLGDVSGAIPDFPDIEFPPGVPIPEDCTVEDVEIFHNIYRQHCEVFLDAVANLETQRVERLWREFWRGQYNKSGELEERKYLSKTKLYLLCNSGPVQQFVWHVDCLFYQNILGILFPDVLRPVPSSVTQGIRNFADILEPSLKGAMIDCPKEIINIKMSTVNALAQMLWRYTSLNHLSQAARAILQKSSQIEHMLDVLIRVDFCSVHKQASWLCQYDDSMVQQLEAHYKNTLHELKSLDRWAARLKDEVTQVLKPKQGKPNFANAARQYLLRWSLYNSMVFKDLTLRRLESSGSLHLIRLLYDEYIIFLMEYQVSLHTGEIPIAVVAENYKNNSSNVGDYMEPENCMGGASLTLGVPVSVKRKRDPTTPAVGSNDVDQHPMPVKLIKSGEICSNSM
jgi:regulatory factor X 1/2/3